MALTTVAAALVKFALEPLFVTTGTGDSRHVDAAGVDAIGTFISFFSGFARRHRYGLSAGITDPYIISLFP